MKELSNIGASNKGEIILYQPDASIRLDVTIEEETVWLTQAQMVILFDRDKSVISRHIKNIFAEEELYLESVVANFATTAADGKVYNVEHYNLDVIISVGYRVKSKRGTQFRQWANRILKEYLMKGFVVNHRIERMETRMGDTEKKIDFILKTILPLKESETNNKINELVRYLEEIINDYNDINEDTRMQLEMINETLAELQSKKKELDKPRKRIGYVQDRV